LGIRVIDEVMTYLVMSRWYEYCSVEEALDAQIIQKIMPKLHGNRKQIEKLLLQLIRFTIGEHADTDLLSEEEKDVLEYEEFYRYPLSGKKAYKMYKQLMNTGYCSFIS
jgi:5-methylcytosine-specific restriction protein B